MRELEEWARASGDWAGFVQALEARASSPAADVDERRTLRMKLAEVSATQTGQQRRRRSAPTASSSRRTRTTTRRSPRSTACCAPSPDRTRRPALALPPAHRARAAAQSSASRSSPSGRFSRRRRSARPPRRPRSTARSSGSTRATSARSARSARLLVASGDAEGAAKVLQQERDLEEGGSRVSRGDRARPALHGPAEEAARGARRREARARARARHDAQVIAVVEELLPLSETRARAAVILEEAYAATGAWQKQGDVLAVLIATAASKSDRLALHTRLAEVKQKLGDLVGRLRGRRARGAGQPGRARALGPPRASSRTRRTGRSSSSRRSPRPFPRRARRACLRTSRSTSPSARRRSTTRCSARSIARRPYLERILARDPSNERAFMRLKQILTTRERWIDLETLYERVIGATADANRRADLLNEVAIIAEEITGDANKAHPLLRAHPRDRAGPRPGDLRARQALRRPRSAGRTSPTSSSGESRSPAPPTRAAEAAARHAPHRIGSPIRRRRSTISRRSSPRDSSLREARELVEKCLTHPDLRQRAADHPRGRLRRARGDARPRTRPRGPPRVRRGRRRAARAAPPDRRAPRRAPLRRRRARSTPTGGSCRSRRETSRPARAISRSRSASSASNDAADVLLVSAKNAESPQPRAEILGEVAKIFEASEQRDRAESIYRQVMDLAPEDPSIALPAVRALERMYGDARQEPRSRRRPSRPGEARGVRRGEARALRPPRQARRGEPLRRRRRDRRLEGAGSRTTRRTSRRSPRSIVSTSGPATTARSSTCFARASASPTAPRHARSSWSVRPATLADRARRRARGDPRVSLGARRLRRRPRDPRGARRALRAGRAVARPRRDARGGARARRRQMPIASRSSRGSATSVARSSPR